MSAAAPRRAFSKLASKIHPQLPLTQGESQQLLTLLTTSFRTHLDREHPVAAPEERLPKSTTQLATIRQSRRAPSSYHSATEHIDSILSNPLFARKPRRRGSDSPVAELLKDPLTWFLDQVTIGGADISKALLCLDALQLQSPSQKNQRPASTIAAWLHTSGQETSSDFRTIAKNAPLNSSMKGSLAYELAPMLLAEGDQAPLWRWFAYTPIEDTSSSKTQTAAFRQGLLGHMVSSARTRDEALAIFLRAHRTIEHANKGMDFKILQVAGGRLVDMIVADSQHPCTLEHYDAFIDSTRSWLRSWRRVAEVMLHSCHPTHPDPDPGLAFIKDPRGAIWHVNAKKSKQKFLVQLCLRVAQQLMEEERYSDAHIAMDFTKEHFAGLVLAKLDSSGTKTTEQNKMQEKMQKDQEEKKNIEMLDRLLLT